MYDSNNVGYLESVVLEIAENVGQCRVLESVVDSILVRKV